MNGYDEWKTGNYGEDYFPDEKPVYFKIFIHTY